MSRKQKWFTIMVLLEFYDSHEKKSKEIFQKSIYKKKFRSRLALNTFMQKKRSIVLI